MGRRGSTFPIVLIAAACLAAATPVVRGEELLSEVSPAVIEEARAELWSLQPVRSPQPPDVKDESWIVSPIDRFVIAKLESAGIAPSPIADRRTLIRRAYFNLVGVPPTFEQVQAFENDPDVLPVAFAKVIDELLASPLYGQRWGRHWLDIARYADTKGYVFTQEPRYPFAYTYRDYVIRAFNDDKPYDRFIVEQIAADKLHARGELSDDRDLAAMGFLTVGRRFSNRLPDIIDDRIDVVTRGLMGLTVACARCHDHKYDAVPTADYYSLYGVFASSFEPDDLPLIGEPQQDEAYRKYEAELNKRQKAVADYKSELVDKIGHELRERTGDYLEYLAKTLPGRGGENVPRQGRRGELRRRAIEEWQEYLIKRSTPDDPVFGVWFELTKLSEQGFAESVKTLVDDLVKRGGEGPANPRVVEAFAKQPPKSIDEAARVYGDLFESIYAKHKHNPAEDPAEEQLRQVLYEDSSPGVVTPDDVDRLRNRAERDHQRNLEKQIEQLMVTNPGAPPRAMVMRDADRLYDPYIFERGSEGRRGPKVDRRFLQVLARDVGGERFEEKTSGRLELAQAIVHEDNPLTMRVWVNRVWQHHFGMGLARGADDFGARSDPPMHDELLDYLVTRFRVEGLSTKRLHRMIMLSATYMQVSDDRSAESAARRLDPENAMVWRQNRRRLEFEPMRDALLHVAGRLDPQLGGRPVDIESRPFTTRRTVYAFVDRQELPGLFRVFDFASPDACTPQRPHTVAPQQALFMMNSPFMIEQVKALTNRPEVQAANTPAKRIEALYRLTFAREPRPQEIELGIAFTDAESAAGDGEGKLSVWEKYGQALMLSNEFLFVD